MLEIIVRLLCLTNIGVICYYIGKGKIEIVIRPRMTKQEFATMKALKEKEIDIQSKIADIQNYQEEGF